ncbi:MAG TPA: FKBP-type peptidyl-prolyl cis-trans isomerase [Polyangiales bacterium]|nr:FKBP-type peptidyl-prolyl cis-trans isomerase [Polyangiales bacterium]
MFRSPFSLCVLLCSAALACNAPPPAAKKEEPAPEPAKPPVTPVPEPSADIPAPADVAAPPADAEKTASGLASKLLQKGTGDAHPHAYDSVKAHYTGWTTDGKMFDSSIKRNEPTTFGLGQVIAGWTEGLQLMVVGEKRRFWIPEPLAYKGQPGRPAGMLVFDVELLEIIPGEAPIPAPDDVAAAPADAKKTASGLAYKVLQKGKGPEKPKKYDRVTVHYTGWTTDGNSFDSSVKRGAPAVFGVSQVIEGWTEGLQLMTVGEKTRFWIPEGLAYKGRPGPPKGMLVFDVELISIEHMPEPPAVPKDVAAAPADAKKTASGLAYKILKKGKGKDHPTTADQVEVHYTGWTTDGKMFDSSVTRGKTITFGVTQVIPGWTEGLQLLVEGDTARLWIPEELAYKGRPGAPQGMLVFDVQLIKIVKPDAPAVTPPAAAAPHDDAHEGHQH